MSIGRAESGCPTVGEDGDRHGPGGRRFFRERDALRGQSRELAGDVCDFERGEWNALGKHRLLKCPAGRIGVRLQSKLEVIASFGRYDRDPSVLADRDVVLLLEAEDVRVEPERFSLIVDHDARELDAHRYPPQSNTLKCVLKRVD